MKTNNSTNTRKLVKKNPLLIFTFFFTMMTALPAAALTTSEILDNSGFKVLKTALDLLDLTPVIDDYTITVFAPTDDVFTETAQALGCDGELDLASKLAQIPVGDINALAYVVGYHVYVGELGNTADILSAGTVTTVINETLSTGVDKNGLYVMGKVNSTPSTITTTGIESDNSSFVYAIDQILLPINPATVCQD